MLPAGRKSTIFVFSVCFSEGKKKEVAVGNSVLSDEDPW